MRKPMGNQHGQSVLEYAITLAAVLIVVLVMVIYYKRAVGGRWKASSDSIGEQFTTGQTYTVETRQQASRKEESGTKAQIDAGSWTQSTVLGKAPEKIDIGKVGGKETEYGGAETSRTDYVTASPGGGELGTHGTFDSGKLKEKGLFSDDQ